jgi:hypothetical protein
MMSSCIKLESDTLDLFLDVIKQYVRIVKLLERKHEELIFSAENENTKLLSETGKLQLSLSDINEASTGFELACIEPPRRQLMNAMCSSVSKVKHIDKLDKQIFRWRGGLEFYKRMVDESFNIDQYTVYKNRNLQFYTNERHVRARIRAGDVVMFALVTGCAITDEDEVARILELHLSYSIASVVRTIPCPEYEDWLDPDTYQLVPKSSSNRCTIVTALSRTPPEYCGDLPNKRVKFR